MSNTSSNSGLTGAFLETPFDWAYFGVTTVTLCLQVYTLCLVVWASPKEMADFRRYLGASTALDMALTILNGYGLAPELMIPYCGGARVKGFFQLFGRDGGRIGISAMVFIVAQMLSVELFSLLYRWSVIQQRWPTFSRSLLGWRWILGQTAFGLTIGAAAAYGAFNFFWWPDLVKWILDNGGGLHSCLWSNLPPYYNQNSTIVILMDGYNMGVFRPLGPEFDYVAGFGFTFFEVSAVLFSAFIIRTLHHHAAMFSAKTYRLHRQLIILLFIQLIAPLFYMILPVMFVAIASGLGGPDGNLTGVNFSDPNWKQQPGVQTSRVYVELGLLAILLFPLNNVLLTFGFITPYRKTTWSLFNRVVAIVCCKKPWGQNGPAIICHDVRVEANGNGNKNGRGGDNNNNNQLHIQRRMSSRGRPITSVAPVVSFAIGNPRINVSNMRQK